MIFNTGVAETRRRRGYGSALLAAMLAHAGAAGAGKAYLQVAAENTGAVEFYTQLGFQEAYPYWYRTQ